MHYTEFQLDENGQQVVQNGRPVRVPVDERFDLLERDLDELVMPKTMPTGHDVMEYVHNAQLIGNNIRKAKRVVGESVDIWKSRVERLQKSVGAFDALSDTTGKRYSDTGNIRKDLRALVTATWGPVDSTSTTAQAHGVKKGLLPLERDAALQIARFIIPDYQEGQEIPEVALSYDDILERKSAHKRRLELMEADLTTKHFDVNNAVKLMELESFDARRTTPARD